MEFRHLKTFQTIVDTGSFLQAAEQLQYAQSTITLHIQQLEAELGVKVFLRQGKRIQLTSAGKALERHANFLLQRTALLHQEMMELVSGKTGHLRIGCVEPVARLQLPKLLVGFCRQYPKIRLTLQTGITDVITQGVAEGKLDLAICSPPIAKLGLNFVLMFYDPVALLISENHPLSHKEEIDVCDLVEERLVLTESNCPYRRVFEQKVVPYGINPYSGLEIMSLTALERMVQSGLGIGVMPSAIITPPPKNTVVRNISNMKLELPIGLALTTEKAIPGLALDLLIETLTKGLKVE